MLRPLPFAFAMCALLAGGAFAQDVCKLTPAGTATVAAVQDGRTLALTDGRTLRLTGIEVTTASTTALQALAAGKPLRLETPGAGRDRYGRLLAFAYADGAKLSLQQALLAAGAARVGPRAGGPACAQPLLEAERSARAARLGIWAQARFLPVKAANRARLRAEAGRFALVEGKVLSVHASGGTIYLNFGRRWTRDFSVIILRRLRPQFAAAGIDPLRLGGRDVRVRGIVEMRRGPVIEAEAPEQIELLDRPSASDKDK